MFWNSNLVTDVFINSPMNLKHEMFWNIVDNFFIANLDGDEP